MYYVKDINSMGSIHYLAQQHYEQEGAGLRQCLLWTGAPKEMRAQLTKADAEKAIETMKRNNPWSSSVYSIEEVK